MPLRLWNTLAGSLKPFVPIRPGRVDIYVCGPTVYDHAHIGHARSAVLFDVVVRYLRYQGYAVRYVRNFTDIDDKIIERARSEQIDAFEISQRYIRSYREDMEALGVLPPDFEPRVTENIEFILRMITRLVESGHAYVQEDGVYYRIRRQADYGRLSSTPTGIATASPKAVSAEFKKEDERDFALWKCSSEEPVWESAWGRGRPGWHIECVAMSCALLGVLFDIHGGGRDLIFPHHENERALSQSLAGTDLARYWLHHELVTINGRKISKSENRDWRIRDLCRRYHPGAIRLFLLSSHYRRPLDFTERRLGEAASAFDRLDGLLRRCEDREESGGRLREGALTLERGFIKAMDDDFNVPRALSLLFTAVRRLNRSLNAARDVQSLSRQNRDELFQIRLLCKSVLGLLGDAPCDGTVSR